MTDFGPTQYRRGADDAVNEIIDKLRRERDEAIAAKDRMISSYVEFVERTRAQAEGANELVESLWTLADDLFGVVCQALVWLDRVEINLRNDEHVADVLSRYEEAKKR